MSDYGLNFFSFQHQLMRDFPPQVLVRGGQTLLKNNLKSATGMSRPVLLSQDGESKRTRQKGHTAAYLHQHWESFLAYFLVDTRK